MNESQRHETKATMKRKQYEKELRKLQTELCRLQEWVKLKGLRVMVIFEGRDAAGKGGTIKAITERVSPPRVPARRPAGPVGPREDADVLAALHAALPGRRRSRDLRPQLVQPRRRGARDGLLLRQGVPALPGELPGGREVHRRRRDHPHQVLAGGGQEGAGAAVRGPHRRPDAAMEAQSDGHRVVDPLVRVLAPATRCWRPPTPSTRLGTSCVRTTRSVPA